MANNCAGLDRGDGVSMMHPGATRREAKVDAFSHVRMTMRHEPSDSTLDVRKIKKVLEAGEPLACNSKRFQLSCTPMSMLLSATVTTKSSHTPTQCRKPIRYRNRVI